VNYSYIQLTIIRRTLGTKDEATGSKDPPQDADKSVYPSGRFGLIETEGSQFCSGKGTWRYTEGDKYINLTLKNDEPDSEHPNLGTK
jgi:hypothetical protein